MAYTPAQLRVLAESVGVDGYSKIAMGFNNVLPDPRYIGKSDSDANSVTMAAIATLESNGNPSAINSSNNDATGLWQIRWSIWGKELTAAKIATSQKDLLDPNKNAKAMKHVLDKQGLKAWTTYNNRNKSSEKKKWDQAFTDAQKGITASQDLFGSQSTDLNPVNAVPSAINAIGGTLLKVGLNIGAILLTLTLLILGVWIIMRANGVKASPPSPLKAFKVAGAPVRGFKNLKNAVGE